MEDRDPGSTGSPIVLSWQTGAVLPGGQHLIHGWTSLETFVAYLGELLILN